MKKAMRDLEFLYGERVCESEDVVMRW